MSDAPTKYAQEVDVFASFAPEDLNRPPDAQSFVHPNRIIEDLQRIVFDRSDIRLNIRSTADYAERKSSFSDALSSVGDAAIFLALISTQYSESKFASETLRMAVFNHRANEHKSRKTPKIIPVHLEYIGSNQQPNLIDFEDVREFFVGLNRIEDKSGKQISPTAEEKYSEEISKLADDVIVFTHTIEAANSNEDSSTIEPQTDLRNIWLARYSPTDMPTFEDHLEPGHVERWSIGDADPDELRTAQSNGDTVAIWRAVVEEGSNIEDIEPSGIVAWGRIDDTKNIRDGKVDLRITDAMPGQPILRETIVEQLGDEVEDWPGDASLRKLTEAETEPLRWHAPAHPAPHTTSEATTAPAEEETPIEETSETRFSADLPETMRDMLGRAPLAFSVAHRINDIWTEQNKERSKKKKHAPDQPGFILHIDSPWGGGKTTFANYVARILNPSAFDIDVGKNNEKQLQNTIFADLKLHDPDFWDPDYAARDWITVQFNAWQHQHVSPPWWDFYETVRKQCFAVFPMGQRTAKQFSEWAWKLFNPSFRSMLIGVILLALVVTTVLNVDNVRDMIAADAGDRSTIALIIASLFGASGIALFTAFQKGINKLVSSAGDSTDATALGTSDPLRRFRKHFSAMIDGLGRPVLVIVDDLDRCEPEYVVELVRGMMTVFRSPRIVFILLGDKHWIETSFAKVHKDMADVHDDIGVSFGGRFVEKAIQMSLVLPEADKIQRDSYVDMLLLGDRRNSSDRRMDRRRQMELEQFADEFDKRIKDARSSERRNEIAETAREALSTLSSDDAKIRKDIINRKKAIRAASSETAEQDVRHALAPLKGLLPTNPRRIKRIVNMITVYQSSAQVAFGVDEKSVDWYQLMLWVILMSEHPQCWSLLVTDPDLLSLSQAQKKKLEGVRKENSNKLDHAEVQILLDGYESPKGHISLDADAIKWLGRLTPVS